MYQRLNVYEDHELIIFKEEELLNIYWLQNTYSKEEKIAVFVMLTTLIKV
jgi:hypothetical protein